MSLSRFYRTSEAFQPDKIIGTGDPTNSDVVWGESIVKKEIAPSSLLADPKQTTEELPAVPQINEKKKISPAPPATLSVEAAEEEPEPSPSAPPKLPPQTTPKQPTIDIDAIREKSFATGLEAGRKQAEEDFENATQTLLSICHEFDKLRETILQNSTGEMKALVMDISEKIIRHSVQEQEDTIVATIQSAIELAVKSDVFQVKINPEDLESLERKKMDLIESISDLDNIIFKPDATIERGGCMLESSCCTVDATLTSQIKIIRDSIMATVPTQKTETI